MEARNEQTNERTNERTGERSDGPGNKNRCVHGCVEVEISINLKDDRDGATRWCQGESTQPDNPGMTNRDEQGRTGLTAPQEIREPHPLK